MHAIAKAVLVSIVFLSFVGIAAPIAATIGWIEYEFAVVLMIPAVGLAGMLATHSIAMGWGIGLEQTEMT